MLGGMLWLAAVMSLQLSKRKIAAISSDYVVG